MKRLWIVTVIVVAMLMTALPASAKKPPGTPGKPPPAEPTLYDVAIEFVPGAEGLSTKADPSCGFADSVVMEWDGRALIATDDEAGAPMLDVNLGPELLWYRDYPYIPSAAAVPVGFDPPIDPARIYGEEITGCHGAGVNVWIDFYGPDDHKYETNTGSFVLAITDGRVNLLWHSDYYIPFWKVTKRKKVSWDGTIEDFTYSGDLTWTNGEDEVVFDPVNGSSGLVSGNLEVTHFSPGTYDPFPGSPRPVEFILTVTPQS